MIDELSYEQFFAIKRLELITNNGRGTYSSYKEMCDDITELLNIVSRVDASNFPYSEDEEKNPNWIEYPLMKTESQKRIEALRSDAESRYVVAFERDTSNPFISRGSFVNETYLAEATLPEAIAGICRVDGGLGRSQIYKLVPVDLEEAYAATGFPKEITILTGMGIPDA